MLTARQKAVLDWQCVEGADEWYANAIEVFGQTEADTLAAAKVNKYAAKYDASTDKRPKAEREV